MLPTCDSFPLIVPQILTKNPLSPKFQSTPILHLQVTHDYVHPTVPIEHFVELSLVDDTNFMQKKLLSFHKEMISANFFGEMCYFGES